MLDIADQWNAWFRKLFQFRNIFDGSRLALNERNVQECQKNKNDVDSPKAEEVGEPTGENGENLEVEIAFFLPRTFQNERLRDSFRLIFLSVAHWK